jgi:ring-1,2-phenylacetyl-CoA epoxidase subunit PaaE
MSKFHSVKVKRIERQTKHAVAITLDIPTELKNDFNYIPGQYITFKVNVAGESFNRSYSLCSSPILSEDPTVAVKEVKGGKVSSYFNQKLKEGELLEVMPPLGNFQAAISKTDNQHYILFGGGSGITPLFSIVKTALHGSIEAKISLFYANYNSESVIFKKELQQLVKEFAGRFTLIHVFDQPAKSGGFLGFGKKVSEELEFVEGMMTSKMCIDLLKAHTDLNFKNAQFYMCGPGGLMDNVSGALAKLQIPSDKIHREYFTEKSESEKQEASVGTPDANFNGTSQVEIIYDGSSYSLEINAKETVLDAALDANVDPPFACMVGACTTCRAKVTEGSVKMKDSEALTSKEIEAGYILTCQAHPTSSVLKINYDE